ncbi:MAG: response regulator transcription factor [Acetobacteraceae bacterium]|nr:MAG: response regulator transcription factor [Acetobacteraceae bacterium]
MSTFLIAEDDPLHRGFLREVLGQCDIGDYRLVEVDNGDDAIREITDQDARGVILDLQMPRQTGVQVARWIWARTPATPILFWSNYADEAYVRGISRIVPATSAYGYLLKSASRDRLSRAINCVFVDGQNIIDREVRSVQDRRNTRTTSLTETEYEVLLDIAIGLTDHAIAERRHISLRSVQGRLQQLYLKLGLEERPQPGAAPAIYNSRGRAVALALIRRLINGRTIEIAEGEYAEEQRTARS